MNPWHVVLVVDDSCAMSGQPSAILNDTLAVLYGDLLLRARIGKERIYVSLVSYGSDVQLILESNDVLECDFSAIPVFRGKRKGRNATAALLEAERIFLENPGEEVSAQPKVFFLSTGIVDNEEEVRIAASRIKLLSLPSGSPQIVSLGFGNVKEEILRNVASDPGQFETLTDVRQICKFVPESGDMYLSSKPNFVEEAIMKL